MSAPLRSSRLGDARSWAVRSVLIEAWPVVVIVTTTFAVLQHLVSTEWMQYLFYNGDSLVLALVGESIDRGEPFQWVFSAQMFLFPEALFYFLSRAVSDGPRAAFLVNVVLNLVAMYAVLRGIAHVLARHSRHRFVEMATALGATLLYVVLVLLEPVASPNRSGIATLYVLSTYNFGVSLGGLALVLVLLWATRAFGAHPLTRGRAWITVGISALLTALIAFSNLLFALEVVAPLWATLLVLVFMDRVPWRLFWQLSAGPALGIVITLVLRGFFAGIFGNQVTNYLALSLIPDSIKNVYFTLEETLSSSEGVLKLILIGALVVGNGAVFIWALYAQSRPALAARLSTAEVFVSAFVAVSSLVIVAGQIATGSTASRYLGPLFVFPMITFVAAGVYVLRRMLISVEGAAARRALGRLALTIVAGASLFFAGIGIAGIAPTASAAQADAYTGTDCLNDFVGNSDLNGVGTFWLARPFQLYGAQSGQILQVKSDLTVDPWMINLASYADKTFSYVILDGTGILTADGITSVLGEPRRVIACDGYSLYDYEGTEGEDELTQRIAESRRVLLKEHYGSEG